jgi:hypothetical protein
MFMANHTDSRTRTPLFFNGGLAFTAAANETFNVEDKSTIDNYDPAAFSIFNTTGLTVDGSKVVGAYDKGFVISPATGYTVTIKLSGSTGDLGDIPNTVVLEGGDRLDRNGVDGKYTLTQSGVVVVSDQPVRIYDEDHYFQITKVVDNAAAAAAAAADAAAAAAAAADAAAASQPIIAPKAPNAKLPKYAMIGIPAAIGLVVIMAMKK